GACMKKRIIILGVAVLAGLMLAAGTQLHGREASARAFPDIIALPDGWQPEGIATGRGPVIYSGSRVNGGIYEASLRTGEGRILVPPQEGRVAIGLAFDKRTGYIFAAGGGGGAAYVYDSATGAAVVAYALPVCGPTFINDVVITRNAAYFTDSQCPQVYRVPLGPGGSLPSPGNVEVIPLSGDYEHVAGFNATGIEATPNGSALIIVQSNTGLLFKVDPSTGIATQIDLGGALMTNGDGILLEGKTLYVVRN